MGVHESAASDVKLVAATTAPSVSGGGNELPNLKQQFVSKAVSMPKELITHVMTAKNRELVLQQTGADVEWSPSDCLANFRDSSEQVRTAARLLARVNMHCLWGCSEEKVSRLLKPGCIESVLCRLSPMDKLPPAEKMLSSTN